MDDQYKDRISNALTKALFEATIVDTGSQRTAILRSEEIIAVLITMIGLIIATSEYVNTPSKLRRFCDELAKRVYRRTKAAQESPAVAERFINRFQVGDL